MRYFQLNNNIKVSRFCFGCEALGGTDWGDNVDIKEIAKSIEYAIEQGVNFFDTADVYGLGLSESRLSSIFSHKRHDLFIATKGGVSWKVGNKGRATTKINSGSPDYIRKAVEDSLKRLRLDRIPAYYIHWPEKGKDMGATAEALYELQNAGKIGVIGCSNFSSKQLLRVLEFAPIKLLQIPVNILSDYPPPQTLDVCTQNNIHIVGYNILASGLLTGKFSSQSVFPSSDRRSRLPQFVGDGLKQSIEKIDLLNKQAKLARLSLTQYSIKTAFSALSVDATIIGIKRKNQLRENILSFNED